MTITSASLPDDVDPDEVVLVARGIATAVAPEAGITAVQARLLESITDALTGVSVDYSCLDPLSPERLAEVLDKRALAYRQRIVHHMVLGELVLRPLPTVVAHRVAVYAEALGVKDDFVRVARRYAQGAYGLAWIDLQRSGFVEHVEDTGAAQAAAAAAAAAAKQAEEPTKVDPALAARWAAYEELPPGSLGRAVWDMYHERGFSLPGTPDGAPGYLAQHDYVHVLADYGTNLKGEIEVFALIGRADPDPKGFAWLATLIGLFETGYIEDTGFFERDIRERNVRAPGMGPRTADAIRRGKLICEKLDTDLFDIDFDENAARPVEEVREILTIPPKAPGAIAAGSPGAFDLEGMSEKQRQVAEKRRGRS